MRDDISGNACGWGDGKWEDDLDRAAEAGQNAHRFSIEWSRVQPGPDAWSKDALLQYQEMARGMVARGLTPVATLHHFSNPQWLMDQGGWESEEVIPRFGKYVEKVVSVLEDYVTLWCTINEPNVYATLGYLMGLFPPGKKDLQTTFRVMENLFQAHAAAYHIIHRQQHEARVGLVVNYRDMIPARRWFPLDRMMVGFTSRLYNDFFPEAAHSGKLKFPFRSLSIPGGKGTQDFLGINYYTQERVAFALHDTDQPLARRSLPQEAALSETGFIAHRPQGLYHALSWGTQFDVPLIVTENGVEDSSDTLRPRYLVEHIHQLWRGINHNWPIKGYFHWTLVDNFEWERGWTQRFGLWDLNRETQERHKRPSADLYAEICRTNALDQEMVKKYAPESLPVLFPE